MSESNVLNEYNELRIGDIVGDTERIVIASTQITERIPDDSYASFIAICAKDSAHHKYAVWEVIARPEGFSSYNGHYYHTLEEALTNYQKRGGI
jgi:hypothetical protein